LIGEILYAQQYTFHGEVYYTDNGLYNLDGTLKADLSPPVTVELWDYDEGGNPPQKLGEQTNVTRNFDITFDENQFILNDDKNNNGKIDPSLGEGPDIFIIIRVWDIPNIVRFERSDGENLIYQSAVIPNFKEFGNRQEFEITSHDDLIPHPEPTPGWPDQINGSYAKAMCHSRRWISEEYNWFLSQVGWSRSQVTVVLINTPGASDAALGDRINLSNSHWYTAHGNIHEYAHCIMYSLYGNKYPEPKCELFCPDPHYINSESGLGFAFTEGWANFMEALLAPDCLIQLDIESNEWWKGEDGDGTNNHGQIVEGAIASVFWQIRGDFSNLWATLGATSHPQHMKDFWDGYMTRVSNAQTFREICERNGIVYSRGKFGRPQDKLNISVENSPPFEMSTDFTNLTEVSGRVTFFATSNLSQELTRSKTPIIQINPEPIINITLEYRKRTAEEEKIEEPNLNFYGTSWNPIGTVTQISPFPNELFAIDVDTTKLEDGMYDIRLVAQDENNTTDTLYPKQDLLASTDTIETQAWLRGKIGAGAFPLSTLRTIIVANAPPYVKQVVVKQGSKIIYDSVNKISNLAREGKVIFKIIFSRTIDIATGDITFGISPPYNQIKIDGFWASTNFPNDTFIGYAYITKNTGDGTHTISISAKDLIGQELDSDEDLNNGYQPGIDTLHHFTIDTTPPEINITGVKRIKIDDEGEIYEGIYSYTPLTGSYTVTDNVKIDKVEASSSGNPAVSDKISDNFTFDKEGCNYITVTAEDLAGNTATSDVNFLLDNTPPTISGLPLDRSCVRTKRPTITAIADDKLSGVKILSVSLDGEKVEVTANAKAENTCPLSNTLQASCTPSSDLFEGEHTVVATATDRAGNIFSEVRKFTEILQNE
jgi:hypothetical protein